MGRARRTRSVALLLCSVAGCLDAPAGAGGEDHGRDAGGDARPGSDGEPGGCPLILDSAFDSAAWEALAPPGSFVDSTSSTVRVRATPSVDDYVYGELHTSEQAPIAGGSLTVGVDGPIVSVSGAVGIAWGNAGDAYHLEVAEGTLRATRITTDGGQTEVCVSGCPEYSWTAHSRLRLLEQDGTVLYQAASDAGEWEDIGSAPGSDLVYAVLVYAGATGPGSGDITVIGAEWRACGE